MKFAKHIHVLSLLSTIPAPVRNDQHPWTRSTSMTPEEALDCWDHLFVYIHEHWAKPQTASNKGSRWTATEMDEIVDCRKMLEMDHKELEEKLETLPPYFREEIFPVAVGRYLLRDLAIPFNHRVSRTFKEFYNRYGNMILA